MSKLTPRLIDHVVLPVPELDLARDRYQALGFTVAPDGRHVFGTENACIKFKNGTFLEPLAIGHRETVEANERKGNTFLRRDAAYRFRNGDNGFSMLVFTGEDVRAERKQFTKAGYDTGKLVRVRRPGVDARLAFILDPRAPDMATFMCQDVNEDQPPVDKKLIKHKNGAKRIASVAICEPVPSDFQYYLQVASGQREIRSHSFGMDFSQPNGTISVLTPSGMSAFYGAQGFGPERGLRLAAVDIAVKDPGAVAGLFDQNGIAYRKIGARLVVDPAPGQGYFLAFVKE